MKQNNLVDPIKMNVAEAFLTPFFNKHLSSIDDLSLSEDKYAGGKIYRGWDTVGVSSDADNFSIKWNGSVMLDEYDKIIVFINFTKNITMSGHCDIDGKRVVMFENIKFKGEPVEAITDVLKEQGERKLVENITLNFSREGELTGKIILSWFGLSNSHKEELIEKTLPKYDAHWEGLINPDGKSGIANNVFGSKVQMERLKEQVRNSKFIDVFKKQEQELSKYLSYTPEKDIREYIPVANHMYRFVRERDRGRLVVDNLVADLALIGYILDREDFSRLAARMVMCCIHTPYWFEGPIQHMTGSNFHHVCFMEDHYLRGIVSALGFLGDYFTYSAKELINNKIKANWEWIDLKSSEPGYRQFMNQGIVGNCGRMIGAYYLYLANRCNKETVEKCYTAHTEVLNNCLNEEGHYTEGAQYYHYSFTSSLLLWFIYSNYKVCDIKQVIPERFKISKKYVEALLSTSSETGLVTPTSNGTGGEYSLLIMSVLAYCCGYEKAKLIVQNKLKEFKAGSHSNLIDILLTCYIMNIDDGVDAVGSLSDECFTVLPKSGLLSYQFDNGKFTFLCERNPLTGHHHYDKGGIVLEYDKKIIFPDIGTTGYENTNSMYMKEKEYHNVCYPVHGKMTVASDFALSRAEMAGYPINEILTVEELYTPQASLVSYSQKGNKLNVVADVAPLYGDTVKKGRRTVDLSVQNKDIDLVLTDEFEFDGNLLPYGDNLCVNYLSYSRWEINGNTASVVEKGVKTSISFVTVNNTPLILTVDDVMADYKNEQVYVLRCQTDKTTHEVIKSTINVRV